MAKKEETNETKSVFAELVAVDCSKHTDKKNGLTYLSWSWAIDEINRRYPNNAYAIRQWRNTEGNEVPYLCDPNLGYMVSTSVTIDGETKEMWLPVMNGANKALKSQPYTYKVWDKQKNCYFDKVVEAATMFDINTAIMRCLVKNYAMFGLGLYIYSGQELPEEEVENRFAAKVNEWLQKIEASSSMSELAQLWGIMPLDVKKADGVAEAKDAKKATFEANNAEKLEAMNQKYSEGQNQA